MRNYFDGAPLSTGLDLTSFDSVDQDYYGKLKDLLGSFPDLLKCTANTAEDVGINVYLRYLKPPDFTYAPENAKVDYQDVRDRALTRTLLHKPLGEPYDFIDTYIDNSDDPLYWHNTKAYMALLYLTLKDKEFNLNNLYENWLA